MENFLRNFATLSAPAKKSFHALRQVHLELRTVNEDGMVNAATFQKEVQVDFRVVQVPPQLRRLDFARTTPSGAFVSRISNNGLPE